MSESEAFTPLSGCEADSGNGQSESVETVPFTCKRCGRQHTLGEQQRCACGAVLPRNTLSLVSGLHASISPLPQAFAAAEAEGQRFLAADLVDAGGAEEMPVRLRAEHAYRAELHVNILKLSTALRMHGLLDRKGRARLGWLQRLESLINTARQIDSTLGLERRAKNIASLSAQEYLAQTRSDSEA